MKKLLIIPLLVGVLTNVIAQNVYEYYQDGKIFFKLKDEVPVEIFEEGQVNLDYFNALESFKSAYKLRSVHQLFYSTDSPVLHRTFKLSFGEASKVDELVRALGKHPDIDYAEKVPLSVTMASANDPNASPTWNWHLFHVNADKAWDYSKGDKNIIVAVTDNAIYTGHEELQPNIWTNPGEIPGNNQDDDGNGQRDDIHGYDFGNNDGDPNPPNVNDLSWSHGTHVASIAAGATNNGKQNASISYNVTLMGLRGTNNSGAYVNEWPMITYAADNGARVINMSWGTPSNSSTGNNAVQYAHGKGCILVAAAGNHGNSQVWYPAGFNNVIAVAGVDNTDKKVSSSAYGNHVDLSAPGWQINGAGTDGPSGAANATGTSQAAPMVSGLAALMLSFNPNLTKTEVENIMKSTAVNIDGLNSSFAGRLGSGRIDAEEAMKEVAKTISILDVGIEEVEKPENFACNAGTQNPELKLTNYGSVALTSVTINYQIDGGQNKVKTWTGNLAGFSSTTVQLDPENFTAGRHTITASTSNPNGANDANTSNDSYTGNVQLYNSTGTPIPFTEDFTTGGFPYNDWAVINPGTPGWTRVTNAGTSGNTSIRVNNFNQASGLVYEVVLPNVDMTAMSSPKLHFKLAQAQRGSSSDNLKVRVSTNCGSTWITRYNKSGSSLATTTPKTSSFTPTANDWSDIEVNLLSYASRTNLLIKFEFTGGGGNNIYIDDINLTGISGIENENLHTIEVFPNPSSGQVKITGIRSETTIEIYDVTGKLINTMNLISGTTDLDLGAQRPGTYLLKFTSEGKVLNKRLVISK